jgi:RND family efflux transporter MFP subunit
MYVYFHVAEKYLVKYLSSGRQKEPLDERRERSLVTMGPGGCGCFPHTGHMDFLDNRVDPETGTIQVRAVFPNPEANLLPGMFVRLRLPIEKLENALLVPDEAVSSDQAGRYLLVVNDKDTVERRTVELGPLENGQRVILKGIQAEDRVVIKGLQRARDGIKVKPVEEAAKPAASKQVGDKAQPPSAN